jgi:hypothetical protein
MSNWIQKLNEIAQGWINDAFKTPEIEALAKVRASLCAKCELNKDNTCNGNAEAKAVKTFDYHGELRYEGKFYNGCYCWLSKKTRSKESLCPIGKW